MNKKAITEHGVMQLIMAVIVVALIAITAPVIGRVFFGSGGAERTAKINLDSLAQGVNIAVAQPGKFASLTMPLFIQENAYIIVAFNAKDSQVKSGCYEEKITRPIACPQGKSCLCLYEDTYGRDFDSGYGENIPVDCRTFPENIVFLAPGNPFEDYEKGYNDKQKKWNFGVKEGAPSIKGLRDTLLPTYYFENLLLYGQCDDMVWNSKDAKVYIEKRIEGSNIRVLVARKAHPTDVRENTLKSHFGTEE